MSSTVHYITSTLFFFNDTATTEIYTLSLHDALPILSAGSLGTADALVRTKMSSVPGDDLLVLDESQLRLLSSTANAGATQMTLTASGPPVAALPMRLNGDALTDLVALQKGQSSPSVLHTEASQTFTVNSTADTDDGTCNAANCTLREAINAANTNAGADTVNFNIPGAGVKTITPTFVLPHLTEAVT